MLLRKLFHALKISPAVRSTAMLFPVLSGAEKKGNFGIFNGKHCVSLRHVTRREKRITIISRLLASSISAWCTLVAILTHYTLHESAITRKKTSPRFGFASAPSSTGNVYRMPVARDFPDIPLRIQIKKLLGKTPPRDSFTRTFCCLLICVACSYETTEGGFIELVILLVAILSVDKKYPALFSRGELSSAADRSTDDSGH